MLLLIAGLPGTGKTTVARAYVALSGAVHLNSDVLRKELGLMGHYAPEDKERVYNELLNRARIALLTGKTVVVDSTFYRSAIRTPFIELANSCQTPLHWVEVTAPEHVMRQRLSRPRPDSEADFSVYTAMKAQFEPLPDPRLIIDTEQETPDTAAEKIREYLEHDG